MKLASGAASESDLIFRKDDLQGAEVAQFPEEHLADMRSISPRESEQALDSEGPCGDRRFSFGAPGFPIAW